MPRKETIKARLDRARSRLTTLEAKKRTVEAELWITQEEYTRLSKLWSANGEADTTLSIALALAFYHHLDDFKYPVDSVLPEALQFVAALRQLHPGWDKAIKRRDSELRETLAAPSCIPPPPIWCVALVRGAHAWHANRRWRYIVRCALLGGRDGGPRRIDPHAAFLDTAPVVVGLPIPDWGGPLAELRGQYDLVRQADEHDMVIHCCPRCKTPVSWNLAAYDDPAKNIPIRCSTCHADM